MSFRCQLFQPHQRPPPGRWSGHFSRHPHRDLAVLLDFLAWPRWPKEGRWRTTPSQGNGQIWCWVWVPKRRDSSSLFLWAFDGSNLGNPFGHNSNSIRIAVLTVSPTPSNTKMWGWFLELSNETTQLMTTRWYTIPDQTLTCRSLSGFGTAVGNCTGATEGTGATEATGATGAGSAGLGAWLVVPGVTGPGVSGIGTDCGMAGNAGALLKPPVMPQWHLLQCRVTHAPC